MVGFTFTHEKAPQQFSHAYSKIIKGFNVLN